MRSRGSLMLTVGVDLVFHTLVLFSLYLLFAGHNRPGGGFVGGLVIGGAFAMRFLATGEPDRVLGRIHPEMLLGIGLLTSATVAITPLFMGGAIMESAVKHVDLPIWGDIGIYSVMFFDIGVYIVVLGLTSAVLEGLGKATGTVQLKRVNPDAGLADSAAAANPSGASSPAASRDGSL